MKNGCNLQGQDERPDGQRISQCAVFVLSRDPRAWVNAYVPQHRAGEACWLLAENVACFGAKVDPALRIHDDFDPVAKRNVEKKCAAQGLRNRDGVPRLEAETLELEAPCLFADAISAVRSPLTHHAPPRLYRR